eukprot:jgi/Mesvir1/1487/Mv14470-RA.1
MSKCDIRSLLKVPFDGADKNFEATQCFDCVKKIDALSKTYPACDKYTCPCVFCTERGKVRRDCPHQCRFTRGKVAEKRPYTHSYLVQPDGSKNVETDPLTQLWMTSVRMYEVQNPGLVSVSAPEWFDTADFERYHPKNKNKPKKKLETTEATSRLPKIMQPRDDEVAETDPLHPLLTKILRDVADTTATHIFRKGCGSLAYYSAWTKSHKCQNAASDNKQHKSNNTWFEITRNGVFQRCFDSECTTYRSPVMGEACPELKRLFKENTQKRGSDATSSAYRFAYMNDFDPRRPTGQGGAQTNAKKYKAFSKRS